MNTTNSAGVLAVLRRMAEQAKGCRGSGAGAGTQQMEDEAAISAVVELEKRAHTMIGGARHREDGRWVVQSDDFDAFRAALAALAGNGKDAQP